MAQRIAAVFHNREAAERAADALADLGAEREHISMLARGDEGTITTSTAVAHDRDDTDFVEPAREVGDSGAPLTTADDEDAASGAATGAAIGAVAGLAAGAMALLVPGFGLVMAAGPLAWALGGAAGTAAAGAIAGGIYGSLRDVGIDEPYARGYEERIRGGDVLVTALIPSIAEDRVLDILAEHGAEDVSFADDTPISQIDAAAAETRIAASDYATTRPQDADLEEGLSGSRVPRTDHEGRIVTDTVPSAATPTNYQRQQQERETASYAESPVGAAATTGAAFNTNIARGEAKEVEGEIRDRAADRTANPIDDLAAKAKKAEGKIQKEFGEAEETIERRR